MDKYEYRRQRLIALRDEKANGNGAQLARTIDKEPSYVTRMLYPEGKAGKKRIGEDMIQIIEEAFGVQGWFGADSGRLSDEAILFARQFDTLPVRYKEMVLQQLNYATDLIKKFPELRQTMPDYMVTDRIGLPGKKIQSPTAPSLKTKTSNRKSQL